MRKILVFWVSCFMAAMSAPIVVGRDRRASACAAQSAALAITGIRSRRTRGLCSGPAARAAPRRKLAKLKLLQPGEQGVLLRNAGSRHASRRRSDKRLPSPLGGREGCQPETGEGSVAARQMPVACSLLPAAAARRRRERKSAAIAKSRPSMVVSRKRSCEAHSASASSFNSSHRIAPSSARTAPHRSSRCHAR